MTFRVLFNFIKSTFVAFIFFFEEASNFELHFYQLTLISDYFTFYSFLILRVKKR